MFSFSHSYQKGVFYIRLSVWVVYLLPEPWWRALYMIISSNFTLKTLCSAIFFPTEKNKQVHDTPSTLSS